MGEAFVAGVGMTPFGRHTDRTLRSLTAEAVAAALADAGASRSDIEVVFFGNVGQGAIEGQHAVRGQTALAAAGIEGMPIINVENACASSSTALSLAVSQVAHGAVDVALVVGAEKMFVPERERIAAVFDGCWDVANAEKNGALMSGMGRGVIPESARGLPKAQSIFMEIYAGIARWHMETFGTTVEQIATAASKNHGHSVFNPLSQFRDAFSLDEVLGGRPVAWPLTVPMCSPVSDGAAALLVCSPRALRRFGANRAVRVLASVVRSGRDRPVGDYRQHVSHLAAVAAYEQAGVDPKDISLAEVHDATSFAEILQTENLMFCDFGEGGQLAESGATRIGGRIPVNPSGGLVSKGHPIGATGAAQIFELVTHLRGEAGSRQVEGARLAIAENGGGFRAVEEAAVCITVLERPQS
ncbi:thiolase family protein [Sphingomonas populi]|uniref:propanoyl-CoA C-acyltransferase n=1 Tax=Sphingomonas populi TaxID=2484750 RepID=A0A4Q6XT48_9SPHN|nr:thiolase family protein [Sphingomonas populi]RZF63440.1 thiolase family protein [Sphingomonas populi]